MIIIILAIIILFILLKQIANKTYLKKTFESHNTITFGNIGTGKDLLFQYIINIRKKAYRSTISYGGRYFHTEIKDLGIKNSYENFINNDIKQITKIKEYEGLDIYIPDVGIYLPCQYDYLLHKKYEDLPPFYALSRHLYNAHIHINVQNLERVWKPLREQADTYIHCLNTTKILGFIICKIRIYESYESASTRKLPIKQRVLNKESKASVDQYNASNGKIKTLRYIIKKKNIKYDTREFHKIIYGYKAPIKERKLKLKRKKKNG